MHLAPYRTNIVLLASAIALAGCAGIPTDRGFSTSAALLTAHGGLTVSVPDSEIEAKRKTADWLGAPLTVESAQRIALTRNPRLVQQYARLGLAQAEIYDAARISNPLFSFSWLDGSAGGEQIGLGLAQNFADLLYLSPRKRRASGELSRIQQEVAGQLLKLAAEVEGAYYAYVSAVAVTELRATSAATGKASCGAPRFRRPLPCTGCSTGRFLSPRSTRSRSQADPLRSRHGPIRGPPTTTRFEAGVNEA